MLIYVGSSEYAQRHAYERTFPAFYQYFILNGKSKCISQFLRIFSHPISLTEQRAFIKPSYNSLTNVNFFRNKSKNSADS